MKTAPIMAILAAGLAVPAHAEVVQSSPEGFVVTTSSATKVHPDEIWQALMQPANWWNGEHSWSLDAANFTLDPVAGGCFCETLPDGGSARHMQVIMAQPGKMLRMSGALGPLQSEPLDGVLTIEIRNEGSASEVVLPMWSAAIPGFRWNRLPLPWTW